MHTFTRSARSFVALSFSLAVLPLHAQQLPDARAVLARYAQATGAAKIATLPGRHTKGTIEMSAQGMTGTVEGYADKDGRNIQMISLAGIDFRTGVDTNFAWSIDAMQGPRLIQGKEFEEQREDLDPRAMRRDPAVVVEATTIERATVDGQPCIKLHLKWKSTKETTECYSEATGLLVSKEGTQTSAMGQMQLTTLYADYKTFEGVTVPTKVTQRAAGTELVSRMTEVTFGPVDPAKLAPPPEIVALRKK
ncbi:MAG TPA: hypothetical protein VE967_00100 [Gemmatimonadaceae bacterium]|nr:hypothetical protein [Gemmatimonadaceae bacterium]